MAHIAILVAGLEVESAQLRITGVAQVSPGGSEIAWVTNVAWDATAATINAAILAAAIAAAEAESLTIGGADKKTLLSGAVDL